MSWARLGRNHCFGSRLLNPDLEQGFLLNPVCSFKKLKKKIQLKKNHNFFYKKCKLDLHEELSCFKVKPPASKDRI